MKTHFVAAFALLVAGPALAQSTSDHTQHHPGGAPAQTQTQPSPAQPQSPAAAQPPAQQMPMGQMMQGMPEQCRTMMQTMPQNCMAMMQQMMQGGGTQGGMMHGGMMQGGTQGHAAPAAPAQAPRTEAGKAYAAAVEKMHGPMMEAIADPDPDVAFVKGMIPHHQSAIDMARVVLAQGKDLEAKKWAADVIREQEREISEMRAWLSKRGKL